MKKLLLLALSLGLVGSFTPTLSAESLPEIVTLTTGIVEKKQGSAAPIPNEALKAAKGAAIFEITKAGLVIGGTGGQGIVVLRKQGGLSSLLPGANWTAPIPVALGGGNFGALVGVSTSRVIVLLNSDQAVKVFTHPGKLAWSAGATGTVGADTQTEQEGGLLSDKDVTIYRDTDGLYAGASFGGSTLKIQDELIHNAYGSNKYLRDIIEGKVETPTYANRLFVLLDGKR